MINYFENPSQSWYENNNTESRTYLKHKFEHVCNMLKVDKITIALLYFTFYMALREDNFTPLTYYADMTKLNTPFL